MQSVLPHAATMHSDGNGDSRAVFAATGVLATPSAITAFPHRLAAREALNANLQRSGHAQVQSQLSAPVMSWQSSSASTFAADTRTNLGESAALPAAMASGGGGGVAEVEVEEGGGGDDMASGLEAPEVAAAGSSRADKDRERKRKRRKNMTTEERAEAARKCKWGRYNKMPGSTFDYDAWKSNGEPTRPPPPPNLG